MVVWVGRVSDGSRVGCRTVVVSVRVSLGGMPRHDTRQSSSKLNSAFFLVNATNGRAIIAKSLMKMRRTLAVPKKPLTSVTFRHSGQFTIFLTLDSSGIRPS